MPFFKLLAIAGLAIIAIQRGDGEKLEAHRAVLAAHSGIMLVGGVISVDRLLGLLSQTMANLDQAAQHFEDALAFCRKAGYKPELAWTCCDYADTLLQRHASTGSARTVAGDGEKAMSLLDESPGHLQRAGHAALDGAGAVPAGDTEGVGLDSYRNPTVLHQVGYMGP